MFFLFCFFSISSFCFGVPSLYNITIDGKIISPADGALYSFVYSEEDASIRFKSNTIETSGFSVDPSEDSGLFRLDSIHFEKYNIHAENLIAFDKTSQVKIEECEWESHYIIILSNKTTILDSVLTGTPSSDGSHSKLLIGQSGTLSVFSDSSCGISGTTVTNLTEVILASHNTGIVSGSLIETDSFLAYAMNEFLCSDSVINSSQTHCTSAINGDGEGPVLFETFVSKNFYETITSVDQYIKDFNKLFETLYSLNSGFNLSHPDLVTLNSFKTSSGYGALVISKNKATIRNYSNISFFSIGVFSPHLLLESSKVSASRLGCPSNKGKGNGTRPIIIGDNCAGNGGSYAGIGGTGMLVSGNNKDFGDLSASEVCVIWGRVSQSVYGERLNPLQEVNLNEFIRPRKHGE